MMFILNTLSFIWARNLDVFYIRCKPSFHTVAQLRQLPFNLLKFKVF